MALSVCWLKWCAPATTADGRSPEHSGLSWTSRLVLPTAEPPSTCSVPSVPRVGGVGSFGVAPHLFCLRCTRLGLCVLSFPALSCALTVERRILCPSTVPTVGWVLSVCFFQIERSSRPPTLSNRYIKQVYRALQQTEYRYWFNCFVSCLGPSFFFFLAICRGQSRLNYFRSDVFFVYWLWPFRLTMPSASSYPAASLFLSPRIRRSPYALLGFTLYSAKSAGTVTAAHVQIAPSGRSKGWG